MKNITGKSEFYLEGFAFYKHHRALAIVDGGVADVGLRITRDESVTSNIPKRNNGKKTHIHYEHDVSMK